MEKIKVSIVILTYNQLELTKNCLISIENNTDIPYELVFVDNASTDGTGSFLEEYCKAIDGKCVSKRLIKNATNIGFGPGVNQGLDLCQGDYVCLLNNDTVVTRNWIVDLIRCLEEDEDAAIVGPVSSGTFYPQYVENGECLDGTVRETNIMYGFCEVFRRDLLFRIGCFDERYRIGNFEDHDFNERVIKNGWKLIIAGNVYIEHLCHKSWKNKAQLDYTTVKNMKKFVEKWGFKKEIHSEINEQTYYECEKAVVLLLENAHDYVRVMQLIDSDQIAADEVIIVDSYSDGMELEKIIESNSSQQRIIRVKVPKNNNLTKEEMYSIGRNNSFAKSISIDVGKE